MGTLTLMFGLLISSFAASAADMSRGTENFYQRDKVACEFIERGSAKELYIVPDAGHVDRYDRTDLIPFAKLTALFKQHLSS